MKQSMRKLNLRTKRLLTAALALACALALVGVTRAWLAHERAVAALAAVDLPMSLLIRAGADEDKAYLDLSNIDVTQADDDGSNFGHKDFVFAVKSAYVSKFKLQLAYTTNNRFSYELYPAAECEATDPDMSVIYSPQSGPDVYYRTSGSKITLTALNAQAGDPKLAKSDDSYAEDTYGEYSNVNRYAYPLYFQSAAQDPVPSVGGTSLNYFILRVIWDVGSNERETDMIYIAAKTVSDD